MVVLLHIGTSMLLLSAFFVQVAILSRWRCHPFASLTFFSLAYAA